MPLTWTLKQWLQTNRGLIITTDRPLRHLKELQEKIRQRTGNKISLRILHNLLEKQPKTLDYRILQLICDAFQCQLKDFCAVREIKILPASARNEMWAAPSSASSAREDARQQTDTTQAAPSPLRAPTLS